MGTRTLKDYIDSGESLMEVSFRSLVPVNSRSEDTYVVDLDRVPKKGDNYLSLIPCSSEERTPVEVPLWQHLDDEVVGNGKVSI